MNKLNIIKSSIKDGIMSEEKEFFPNLTEENIKLLYKNNLNKFLKKINLKEEDIVLIDDNNIEEGYLILKEGKKKNNTKKEVIIIRSSLPNFLVGVKTNDYPLIMGSVTIKEETVCGVCLGNLENINNEILDKLVGYLIMETGCAPYDITFYISSCISKEKLIIDEQKYLTSRVLKMGIEKQKNGSHLDLRLAIFNELYSQIVEADHIYFDTDNIEDNFNYFSKIGNRNGKNIIGVVFNEEV